LQYYPCNGKEPDVQRCNVECGRNVEVKSHPSSGIYGGAVNVTIESIEDTSIIEAMVSQYKPRFGNAVFNKGNEAAEMKRAHK
jgi:hypothetical protein